MMHAASPRAAEKSVGRIQAELQFRPIPTRIYTISTTNTAASDLGNVDRNTGRALATWRKVALIATLISIGCLAGSSEHS